MIEIRSYHYDHAKRLDEHTLRSILDFDPEGLAEELGRSQAHACGGGPVAAVMIAAAALPVAGNVFILAQHYRVAPQRASAAILISTAVSVLTFSGVIAWVQGFAG